MPAIILLSPQSIPAASHVIDFFASSTSASGSSVTLPAGIAAGDLIVVFNKAVAGFGGVPSTVVPTGFTSIINTSASGSPAGNDARCIASYKLANGSEGGSSVAGMSGSFIALIFRPNFTASAITPKSTAGEITSGNPALQTVTSGTGTVPLIVFGFYGQSINSITTRTFSPAADAEVAAGSNLTFAKYKIYNAGASSSNHSVDMNDDGDFNMLQSFYLEAA